MLTPVDLPSVGPDSLLRSGLLASGVTDEELRRLRRRGELAVLGCVPSWFDEVGLVRTARTVPGVTGNDDEPTAAAATRHRIEGAAFALEAVSSQMLRQDGPASGSSFG